MNVTLIAGHVTSRGCIFAIDLVILGHLQYHVSSGTKADGYDEHPEQPEH